MDIKPSYRNTKLFTLIKLSTIMKKLFLSLIALVAAVGVQAQQIAVVQSNGSTSVHSLLVDAIEAANAGSVIYLPGGSFPVDDSVKITKPITIMGIGHRWKSDNAEDYAYTTVTGNLFFNAGSSGSALMGVYLTGNVYIANDGNKVDHILVRWCNINQVFVQKNTCEGTVVNQNYIRNYADFGGAKGEFTNNIAHSINELDNGTIAYNVICSRCTAYYWADPAIRACDQCAINYNIFLDSNYGPHSGSSCTGIGNLLLGNWGDDPINVSGVDWADIFENYVGITPNSSCHFKGDYKQYEHKCGIYAGGGFSDTALPPIPYIVAKSIPQQTDSEGKLNIKVRVRASE